MLILSRKKGERIIVERQDTSGVCLERMTITVASLSSEKVRLGFEAGSRWIVNREEVAMRHHAERPMRTVVKNKEIDSE